MSIQRPTYNFWTILGGLTIILLGIGALVGALHLGVLKMHRDFRQFTAPGAFTVELKKPGKYTVFNEYKSHLRGKEYFNPSIPAMELKVKNKLSHEKIESWKTEVPSIYVIGDRSGQALYEFKVDKPGTYQIDVRWERGDQEPQAVFSVAGSFREAMITSAIQGGAFLILSLVLGLGIIINHVGYINMLCRQYD